VQEKPEGNINISQTAFIVAAREALRRVSL
jgi:hypothetical protein